MFKLISICALSLLCLVVRAETVNFDDAKVGEVPKGWVAGSTEKGTPKWSVEADATAPSKGNVLKQSGEGKFPYCFKSDVVLKDGFVETKFKVLSGQVDQAAGLMFRVKDGNNYYIARTNSLENNVAIYFTKDGKRNTLRYEDTDPIPLNVWNTLRIDFKDSKFTVSVNGKAYITVEDKTFTEAGAVGVWTKADSVTVFDDLQFGEAK